VEKNSFRKCDYREIWRTARNFTTLALKNPSIQRATVVTPGSAVLPPFAVRGDADDLLSFVFSPAIQKTGSIIQGEGADHFEQPDLPPAGSPKPRIEKRFRVRHDPGRLWIGIACSVHRRLPGIGVL
jgi:hypothetical protein